MTLPIPVHVAASGAEMLVWLIVGIIWLVFQGLASAAKKKLPPDESSSSPRPTPPQRDEVPGDELRDLIETLTGRKPPMQADEDEEEEPPALPRPAPKPVIVRKVILPPPRVVQPLRRMAEPESRSVEPPPVPHITPAPAPVMDSHVVFAQAAMTRESLRLAPLMKMKWPSSQFQRLGGAAKRTLNASKLKHQLVGHAALRQAMVSRIVLGLPGGR